MKKMLKAATLVVVGSGMFAICLWVGLAMWFSSDFLPIYVGDTYVVGNRILRLELYAALGVGAWFFGRTAANGFEYIEAVLKRWKRQH